SASVRLVEIDSRKERSLKGKVNRLESLAFSPDGKFLATGASSTGVTSTVILWDLATGKERRSLETQIWGRSPLAFSPGGTLLATVGTGDSIKLWVVSDLLDDAFQEKVAGIKKAREQLSKWAYVEQAGTGLRVTPNQNATNDNLKELSKVPQIT